MTGDPIIWKKQNLRELPKFRDSTGYLLSLIHI